ncbi:MAG: hypothetical protein HIU84_10940 [Acidobacteria bacterium]|nr:hypothetical protein [Acidobacteriota bacterium]
MTLLVEKKEKRLTEETTVLIPEARLRKRRRRLRTGVILVIVSAVVILASTYVGGLGSHTLPRSSAGGGPTKGSVTVLPVGTVISIRRSMAFWVGYDTSGPISGHLGLGQRGGASSNASDSKVIQLRVLQVPLDSLTG